MQVGRGKTDEIGMACVKMRGELGRDGCSCEDEVG